MYPVPSVPGLADCRRVSIPTCEPDVVASQSAPIDAIATFQIRKRDKLDFKVDASEWLAFNGNATLTNATWAVASGSPSTPTINGQTFSPQGQIVAVISPANDAQPGDAYWFDVTLDVGATTPVNPGDVIIPARKIVRRVYIIVAAG